MVKKLKQNRFEKTSNSKGMKVKAKSGKATAIAKQKVIINVGGKGGGGRTRQRAPVRQVQPQYIQQPTQAPPQYDFNQFKNDIMENVGKKISDYAGNKTADILNMNPMPQNISSTNTSYDVASLLTAGTGAVKTAYDIYKDYKREQKETAPVVLPVAPLRRPISQIAPSGLPNQTSSVLPAREQKEREVKENPTNYDVPPRVVVPSVYVVPQIGIRPERKALPTERKKTPAELSTEQMLADRDRRNKMTQEAKEAGKPLIPFMNIEEKKEVYKPPQIARRPERQALPSGLPKQTLSALPTRIEPQFSVGEEPKEIITGSVKNLKIEPYVIPPQFTPEQVKRRILINKPFNITETERKAELQQAQIIKAPIFEIPQYKDTSNTRFIDNMENEIKQMKKELEQDKKVSDILQFKPYTNVASSDYLKFINETQQHKHRQIEEPPTRQPPEIPKMKQTPLQVKTGAILNQPIPIIKTERGKPTQAEVIKAPQASKAIIGYMPVKKEEEKAQPAQSPKPLGKRGQGAKPKAGQTEDKKIKAQKAKEAYTNTTPEQKQQKQIKQEELRAKKKQVKLEAKK